MPTLEKKAGARAGSRSGLALGCGGALGLLCLTLGSVLNVKQLLLKSLLLFLLNVKTQKQCFSVNVEQLYLQLHRYSLLVQL